MKANRWQDWVMLVLGIWLFFSPLWMAGYAMTTSVAAWNAYIFGALVFAFAWAALVTARRWEEWLQLLFGIWLVIAPFVLRFQTAEHGAAVSQIVLGLLIGIDAFWALVTTPRQALRA